MNLFFLLTRTCVQHSPDNQFFAIAIKWILSFWQIVPQAMSLSTFAHDSEFSFFVQWVRSHASHIRKANSMRERVGEIQLIGVFSFNWPLNVEADFVITKIRSTNNMGFDFHATTITLTEQQSRTFMCSVHACQVIDSHTRISLTQFDFSDCCSRQS